ncbi:trihelix transcription factor GT-3b-like [Dioscorea cayenensis subsp. rotundata]|uniref:Trihelix transcription factor GT-3b-like n=1 Tax=Dioscorea cayennensis subsp. rotundata TaxID=55577 RepID=A0AB40CNB0_DIOCR|nr:trihelix transcription factor GT-3b-like [Dioscorea cayenensis subsp. rotundata]
MMLGLGGDGIGMLIPLQFDAAEMAVVGTAADGGGGSQQHQQQRGKEGERVPQWSHAETKEFIAIRAELERDFTVSKRNKTLWEVVSARMRERGYRRSPEQCKCKWKNLVNRYKGKETSDPENGKQCPFFEELHAVFQERARSMQQLLHESESGPPQAKKRLKRPSGDRSSDELSEDDEDDEDTDDERLSRSRKKKGDKGQQQQQQRAADKSKASNSVHDILQDFLQQQQRMEAQWKAMVDRRTKERQMLENEWRQSMQTLERERMMLEQAWREREEQRRIREETRAEKRDVLLTTLLNKLIQEGL